MATMPLFPLQGVEYKTLDDCIRAWYDGKQFFHYLMDGSTNKVSIVDQERIRKVGFTHVCLHKDMSMTSRSIREVVLS